MSNIGALIWAYQDKHGTSDRALATRIGVSPTLVGRWKSGSFVEIPKKDKLDALAGQLNVDYGTVLNAFLVDVGYLPEESDGNDEDRAPSMTVTELSAHQPMVAGDELRGLPNVAHKRSRKAKGRDGE